MINDKNKSTFCSLAWNHIQVLPGGNLRPCCRSLNDKIPKDFQHGIQNIEKIRNSDFIKNIRQKMLNGDSVDGCQKCYEEERAQKKQSIRQLYNKAYGMAQRINYENPKIQFLEIATSNVCNLKCRICSPFFSTKWNEDAVEMSIQSFYPTKYKLSDVFREQVNISGRKNPIVPKTKGQSIYLDAIRDYDITFGVGPAGTGKTYLAMAMAVAALTKKRVSRVVLCRPAVEAGEKLGFLPGSMEEKVNPYLTPLYDALYDMVDAERAHEMVERGQIEVAPLAFMRGRTLSNAFVIVDEAQNTTPVQMKMILTRLGQGSKLVVTGDVSQIDLPRGVGSGLIDALRVLKTVEDVSINILTEIDVIRHPVVASVLRAYAKYGSESES